MENNADFQFKAGVLAGTLLLVKLEICLIILTLLMGVFFSDLTLVFNVTAIIIGVIVCFGHLKTTFSVLETLSDPNFSPEGLSEYQESDKPFNTIFNNIFIGVKWRFNKEIIYIKEIASFNFKP